MRIAVIGAGIVGISTAFELASDGHQVTVWDQHAAAAEEASFANAGLLAPSLLMPHSHSSWPDVSWLGRLRGPTGICLQRSATLADWMWAFHWNRHVSPSTFEARISACRELLNFSQTQLHATATKLNLNFEQSEGLVALLPTASVATQWKPRLDLLKSMGSQLRELTPDQARNLEPALSSLLPLHGALHLAKDEVGNCRQFSQLLRDKALEMGVNFAMGKAVTRITGHTGPTLQVSDQTEPLAFDHVVVCAGAGSQKLLDKLQPKLGLVNLHSFTVSSHLREPLNAPRSAVLDLQSQICIVRMGARVRASGCAQLGAPSAGHRAQALKRLFTALQSSFPGAISMQSAVQVWQGSSTMSPDGLPLLGRSSAPGIWINTGHGANGWGMACGSARLLADAISGDASALNMEPFAPGRFVS